ncbi:hypothetical protein F7725_019536, partial [Dissostichus mawsoni]
MDYSLHLGSRVSISTAHLECTPTLSGAWRRARCTDGAAEGATFCSSFEPLTSSVVAARPPFCPRHWSLPLRHRMDDEEEDMSRPISQLWGTPFMDVKYEERVTQIAAGQAMAAVTTNSHNNNSIGINSLPCGMHRQPRIPFHGYSLRTALKDPSNAGLRSHFPAQFEPMEDRGERQIEEEEEEGRGEEDDRMAERPEEQAGVSVEAQIGRKLREIGDKFHQDHVEL